MSTGHKKETKRRENSGNEGKDKGAKKWTIIVALLGGLVGSLLTIPVTYFAYYEPQLELMGAQIELMREDIERKDIEGELSVLRHGRPWAKEALEKREAQGENVTELWKTLDEAVEHAMNASDSKLRGDFPDAWNEIERSREKFREIIPLFYDRPFQERNGQF